MKIVLLIIIALSLQSCTDTDKASWTAVGKVGEIACYSGGVVIYKGTSTGRIQSAQNSDGWEFKDAETGKLIRVSGACVIRN